MFRRLLSGAGLALGVFHVWLFVRQAVNGELSSPDALLKWLAAAGLGAAFVMLRRQRVPLVRGRRAVAVWTLVALLHAPAIGERIATLDTPAIPVAVITLSEVIAAIAPLAGMLLLLWAACARALPPSAVRSASALIVPSALRPPRAAVAFSPRPPPSA